AIDLPPIINIDQQLQEGTVLSFWTVGKQEAQSASADKRRDMRDVRQALNVALDISGESLGFSDVGAGRKEDVHHELRPIRVGEKALLDPREAVKTWYESHDAENHGHPTEAKRQGQQASIVAEEKAGVRVFALLGPAARLWLEQQVTQKGRHR